MTQLLSLQAQFQRAILTFDEAFEREIVATERVGAKQRIEIYADAYRLRLIECLQENYEALHALLGDAQFNQLCRSYIDAHPPHHYSIRWYGDRLAEFAKQTAPYSDHAYLGELAELEWKLTEAFDGREIPPVTIDAMARIAPEQWPQLSFALHPTLKHLQLWWNVAAIRSAIDEERDPVEPQRGERCVPWIVWRQDLRQYFRSMDDAEAWALDHVGRGGSFGALCEGLCQWKNESEVAGYAAGLLKQWIHDGLVTAIHVQQV